MLRIKFLGMGIMALLAFKTLEEILPKEQFIRENKSHIVALQSISGIEGNIVQLGDLTVPIGGTYRDNVTMLFVEKRCKNI